MFSNEMFYHYFKKYYTNYVTLYPAQVRLILVQTY